MYKVNGRKVSIERLVKSLPEILDNETGLKNSNYWFIRNDEPDILRIHGEISGKENDQTGCSYYGDYSWCGEFGDNGFGYSCIRIELQDWAREKGLFWEWDDAGSCSLYQA